MNDLREKVYVDRRPPAASDNTTKLQALGLATALAVGCMALVFWLMAANAPLPEPEPADSAPPPNAAAPLPSPAPSPTEANAVPPAPASNELISNEWLLSPYAVVQEAGNLTVTGTLQNLAGNTRSAQVTVYVYVNGAPIATTTGAVADIAGGASTFVSLPSGTPWQPGSKVLLVVAEESAAAGTDAGGGVLP